MATVFLVTGPLGDDLSQTKIACRTLEEAESVVEELVIQHVDWWTKDSGDGLIFAQMVDRVGLPEDSTYELKLSCINEARELLEEYDCKITVEEIRYEDNNVMRCKAETCSKLFVRIRRQLYCSKSCAQKVRSKYWYARHGEDKRRKNREAYRKARNAQKENKDES
jgi:hypothetical protein